MVRITSLVVLCLLISLLFIGQASSDTKEPSLPVIDYEACPFEGCTFRKWIVTHDSRIFSSWKDDKTPVLLLKRGEVVTGLTGVHITYTPDRIQVIRPIPDLHLQAGDIILRYMYHGEGFADIWAKGQWKKEYDCTFITEKDGSGCQRNCPAKVLSEGKKAWWVNLKTAQSSTGWAKVDDQFDCMDSLGGDDKCASLNADIH
jgi:hypothetical protein